MTISLQFSTIKPKHNDRRINRADTSSLACIVALCSCGLLCADRWTVIIWRVARDWNINGFELWSEMDFRVETDGRQKTIFILLLFLMEMVKRKIIPSSGAICTNSPLKNCCNFLEKLRCFRLGWNFKCNHQNCWSFALDLMSIVIRSTLSKNNTSMQQKKMHKFHL